MATIVCFHAHPDDESMIEAGSIAAATDTGHRVVLVVATRGEQGEPKPGVLAPGEALGSRREAETRRSAEILGVDRVHFLGYRDSGMMGEPTNDDPACFWRADVEDAAGGLAAVLAAEGADALTIYDEWGTYGHPDHIQVHRVGRRAAERAGLPADRVYAVTINRRRIDDLRAAQQAKGGGEPEDQAPEDLGVPEELITHEVDVSATLDRKRRSMEAHRSQISDDDFFMQMPAERFREAFGIESFICLGAPRPPGRPPLDDLWGELR